MLDGPHRGQDIGRRHGAHVANAEVPCLDLRVQPTGQDDPGLVDTLQQRGVDTLRVVGCRQRRGRHRRAHWNLLQSQGCHRRLERLAQPAVPGETGLHPFLQDLAQAHIQCPDQVHRRRAKVARLPCLVGLHDGQPLGPVSVVVAHRLLALAERLHGPRPGHHQGQPRRYANGLLGSRQGQVNAPLLLAYLLASHRTHAIHHNQNAVLAAESSQSLYVRAYGSGCVHMGNGHHLVLSLFELGLHLFQRRRVANSRCMDLAHLGAVPFQDGRVAVAKVAGIDHQGPVAGLDKVCRSDVHGQRTRPGDDKRLSAGAQPYLAHPFQRLAKHFDEIGSDVAGCGHAHRPQDLRRELDGTGDHEQFPVLHARIPPSTKASRNAWRSPSTRSSSGERTGPP